MTGVTMDQARGAIVSRYFRYKDRQALRDDAAAMRLEIELDADLSPLREPTVVDDRRVGNRLAIQPMEGCDGNLDGTPGELTLRRYRRFGAGGAKLIWGEACAVVPDGRANPRQLLLTEATAGAIEELQQTSRKAHIEAWGTDSDLLIGLQLTHSGRYSCSGPSIAMHDALLDPRTVLDRATGRIIPPDHPLISDDALDRLQDDYVRAAGLAFRAGFDFIDLKQCHRYLLNELLAARTRPGKYGGSLENRTRFVCGLVARIRDENPGRIIATRLNVFDGVPYVKGPDGRGVPVSFATPVTSCWGSRTDAPHEPDLSEPKRLVGMLQQAGVSLLNLSLGNPYASPHLIRPFEYAPPDGYETPEHPLIGVARHFRLTGEIQRTFPGLAVVGSGYSWLQAFAFEAGAANLRRGLAAFVGIGRGALSQPDFGGRVLSGVPLDHKRLCRTFSYCTALMRSKHNDLGQFPTGCPPFDKEVYGPIWDEARR
jgi:2,4-dienoyl-CoA reductase-like NADH-dependent reductase (Old Yellow Enzyme family)